MELMITPNNFTKVSLIFSGVCVCVWLLMRNAEWDNFLVPNQYEKTHKIIVSDLGSPFTEYLQKLQLTILW